jgi:toxin YoeB
LNVVFSEIGWSDYLYWQKIDKKNALRINKLIKEISRTPFTGIGKPEPLKHVLSGYWSRRITNEHRLVYKVDEKNIYIAQCRYHY